MIYNLRLRGRMKNISTTVSLLGILTFWAPSLSQAQEISCDELKKIQITDSNRETILKKYKDAIYRCAGITSKDSLLLSISELPTIAKHGAISNVPSKTIGDLINELHLIKAEPQYDDVRDLANFVYENIDKKIDIKDKQKVIQPLTMLAVNGDDEKLDANQLIDYLFSPACKGLTYQQGYIKFLELQKKKK
ncbi:hypothetical protein [Sphingobacterium yanglingense]|uniref:Uncharacterized protein n=1 Tax=Sphingobacterium yanglingense TaxID=1437280 RepID=A0A4R6WSQ9_9SPHI|nr:hypothetical protein [Sphingobacterium yanglingense]TDQ79756.1 hypothetical protein CLV99_1204 [Sphingobacterium yanglingense]